MNKDQLREAVLGTAAWTKAGFINESAAVEQQEILEESSEEVVEAHVCPLCESHLEEELSDEQLMEHAGAMYQTFQEAEQILAEAAAAEPAATGGMAKGKGKGHAWGKNKHFLELRKHLQRLAKLKRLEEIAKEKKNDKLLSKIQALRTKETERHTRTLAKVDAKESIKDVKEAAKDAKKAVKEAKKAE